MTGHRDIPGVEHTNPAVDPPWRPDLDVPGDARIRATVEPSSSVTCPRCGKTSHDPRDVRHGWCGACQDGTSPPRMHR